MPKAAAQEWIEDWDGEPHIEHTWQLDVGELSTEWGVEGREEELSVGGADENWDITRRTLGNLPVPKYIGGGMLREVGKRPIVAAKKEKMRLEQLEKPALSEEEEAAKRTATEERRAAKRETRLLTKVSKIKAYREERATRKEDKRQEKLAELMAEEELKTAKKRKRRLAQRAKWAAVEETATLAGVAVGEKQEQVEEGKCEMAKLVGDVRITREEGQRKFEEGKCEEMTKLVGDTRIAREEGQGQVESRPGEKKVGVTVGVKEMATAKGSLKSRKQRTKWWLAYQANNHRTLVHRPHPPTFKETRTPTAQSLEASTDSVLPPKKTRRGRRALPITRRPSHFPPYQNNRSTRRTLAPTSFSHPPSHERKPHGPSLKRKHWNLPSLEVDVEPTRLQRYLASQPRSGVEHWMVMKAKLQKKLQGEQWNSKKKLSPAALDGIRALHKSHPEYTTKKLSDLFQISGEAIRRVLKSNWKQDEATQKARMEHWAKRGVRVYRRWEQLGVIQSKSAKKQVRDRRKEREAMWGKQEDGWRRDGDRDTTKLDMTVISERIL